MRQLIFFISTIFSLGAHAQTPALDAEPKPYRTIQHYGDSVKTEIKRVVKMRAKMSNRPDTLAIMEYVEGKVSRYISFSLQAKRESTYDYQYIGSSEIQTNHKPESLKGQRLSIKRLLAKDGKPTSTYNWTVLGKDTINNVKSVFEYDEQRRQILVTEYQFGKLSSRRQSVFDGEKLKEYRLFVNLGTVNERPGSKYEFAYDESGNLSEIKLHYFIKGKFELESVKKFEYQGDKLIRKINSKPQDSTKNSSATFAYDQKGNLARLLSKRNGDSIKVDIQYDDLNRVSKKNVHIMSTTMFEEFPMYVERGAKFPYKVEENYLYDSRGNLVAIEKSADGSIIERLIFEITYW
ncbi:MAG: hypothetical protein EOO50_08315 [Flavobacterium sp.]|uniref:hypothetical protein n=1 Tax=Flavobacterium sp. TaxID=239 RepID=UPI00121E4C10|nr:hypothetical protein [Flavobacterium sp.]RZJ66880.1 MAG: hypothetical protein EOO50_08315 [Flavobacterium sp.]